MKMDRLRTGSGGRWPGAFGSNPASGLSIPLQTSAVPARGNGSSTFTRALSAYMIDFEGLLRTCVAGELRERGTRHVYNLYATTASATSSIAIAGTITYTNPGPTSIFIFSMGPGTGTATFSGTSGASGTLAADATRRTSVTKTLPAGTIIVTGSVGVLTDVQLEVVSGQTVQQPSEYVSVGVTSAPYYHGAFVDGAKNFSWQNGNTVASNIVTETQGATLSVASRGYMRQPARINLLLQSNSIDNASYTKPRTTVAANGAAGPDGFNTADQITANATDVAGAPNSQDVTLVANTQYTLSWFVKRVSGTTKFVLLSLTDGTNEQGTYVDVQSAATGTAVNGSSLSTGSGFTNVYRHAPVAYLGGWSRIAITMTIAATTTCTAKLTIVDADASLSVTSGQTRLVAHAQLEAGSAPTSPIVTTTATIQRPADAESHPQLANYLAAQGMAYAEVTMEPNALADGLDHIILGNAGGGKFVYANTTDGKVFTNDGTNTASVEGSSFYTANPVSVAAVWGGSALTAYSGGVPGTAGTFDGAMPTGAIDFGSGAFNGTIRKILFNTQAPAASTVADISIGSIALAYVSATVFTVRVPVSGAPSPLIVYEIQFLKQPSSLVWWMGHVTIKDLSSGGAADSELTYNGTSVWEYARQIGESAETYVSGSTYDFYGCGHGFENRLTFSVLLDGAEVTVAGAIPVGFSGTGSRINISQTMEILKPRTGAIPPGAIAAGTAIGTGSLAHAITLTGIVVDHTHKITAAGLRYRPAYGAMLAVEPTKFNKAQAGAQAAVTITAPGVDTVIATDLTETVYKVFHSNTATNPYQITMTLLYGTPERDTAWASIATPKAFFLDNPLRFKIYACDVGDAGAAITPGAETTHRQHYQVTYVP